ncbi:LacI family DNA-binding transcriptional regulator [Listeria kieliensis]|uniref:LacI family transcriptional regulator n=1 Tax=Listeria kieliensis TaxID=1621700 RepID=A0A3D8TTL6_9LIST|nr:LacI family DNA-binding transcriptional regulator [Listeria kieliensis]RDX01166.1 LacI family transcriptional regulator [Listeria kieliensis]
MPNIKEIAKRAGVSVTTVSRVLNHHPYVASDKRARVEAIIQELDYIPNRSAMNLARGKTNTVGVLLPYTDHPWFDKIASGILEAAFREKYSVTLLPTGYDAKRELHHLEMLKTKQLDGIIITSRANPFEALLEAADPEQLVFCEETKNPELSCAYINRFQAFQDGFRFIQNKGYRNVAFTTGRTDRISPSTQNKIAAFEEVFATKANRANMLNDCYDVSDGEAAAEYFLEKAPVKPDAIYATGDEVAAGIFAYARKNGLRVPEDIAILGQENLPISEVLEISTLNHHLKRLGTTAFSIFHSGEVQKQKIHHELVERKSL